MATRDVEQRRPPLASEALPELDVAPSLDQVRDSVAPPHHVPIASPRPPSRKRTASQRGYGPDPRNNSAERALFKAYMDAAGWELDVSNAELAKQLVSRQDVEKLRSGKSDVVPGANGKLYRKDPDHPGKIIGYDPSRLPASDAWSAARMSPMHYFAAHYQIAQTDPMRVFHDLISVPSNQVAFAEVDLNSTEWQLTRQLDSSGHKEALVAAQLNLAIAKRAQSGLARQFYIMRNEVFRTDVEEHKAAERLRSEGFDTAQFHVEARFKCTPEQIRALETKYRELVPAKVAGFPGATSGALNSAS